MKRGAFLVLEGCDRAGKSTQAKLLIARLKSLSTPAIYFSFPDRRTTVGEVINNFLSNKTHVQPEAVHLLFSVNRWEISEKIYEAVSKGITVVVDRYAASGAAYGAANTGRDLEWCKEPDRGLPSPDVVFYLKIDQNSQQMRNKYGEERFEKPEFQARVAENFELLKDKSWEVIDATLDLEEIHEHVLNIALKTVHNVQNEPVKLLYENNFKL